MSWQIEIPLIIRTIINDFGPIYSYSDERLLQVAVVAAQYVQSDVNLDNKYIINIVNPNLSPDPTLLSPKDDIFINLLSLKASCIIDQSAFRTKSAVEGVRAALGPASLSISNNNLSGYKTLLDQGPCALYRSLVDQWNIGNASAVRAVLTPFVGNNFDPQNLNTSDGDYSRYKNNQFF